MLQYIRTLTRKGKYKTLAKEEKAKARQMTKLRTAERKFRKQMLTFRKKEDEMRKFDNATELTYLSKKIENLDETMEDMQEWMDAYNDRQKVIMRMLVDFFN